MFFLIVMVVGLVGLVMMALPALGGHGGHAGTGHAGDVGHSAGHLGAGHGASGHHGVGGDAAHGHGTTAQTGAPHSPSAFRFLASPRAIFSLLALYGAFANALVRAGHLPMFTAGLVALVPALIVERFVVTPLWNVMFRFQGKPSSSLHELVLSEAKAVTAFKNGRGVVSVERDGRAVQFVAQLPDAQASLPIRVGEMLRVEEVDTERERLVVSVPSPRNEKPSSS